MFPRRKARRAANNDCPAKAGHGVPYRYNFNTDGNGWSSEDRRYEIKCRINCPEAMRCSGRAWRGAPTRRLAFQALLLDCDG
jgi:hypothetical protein